MIEYLSEQFSDLRTALESITGRVVDLHPVVKEHYYHRDMRGSFSLKAVLPTIAPELDHATLGEVRDGGGAQQAYLEAIRPDTADQRREELRTKLLAYCERDTLAMVRIVRALSGEGRPCVRSPTHSGPPRGHASDNAG